MSKKEKCLYFLVAAVVGVAGAFLLRFGYEVLDVILYPYK